MTKQYNFENIRTLLTEGFSDRELRDFCFYKATFKSVYFQLAENTGKTEIIRRLLEYAVQKELVEPLLDYAKENNPAKYKKHQPYYEVTDNHTLAEDDDDEIAEVELSPPPQKPPASNHQPQPQVGSQDVDNFVPNTIIELPQVGLKDFGSSQESLLQRLYPDEQRVMVEREFGGGFGGTQVFLVRPIDQRGRMLARQIVKIGPPLALKREQQNYLDHVKKSHSFVAAEVTRFVEWQGLGGIIYNFVGDSRLGETRTLEEVFLDEQISAEAINQTLTDLLDKALGEQWYHQTEPHTCFFADEYGPHLLEHLRIKVRPASLDGLWLAGQEADFVDFYEQLKADLILEKHATLHPGELVQLDNLKITKAKPDLLKLQHPTQPGVVVKVETSAAANFTPGQAVTVRGEVRYNRLAQLAQIMTTAFTNFPEASVDAQAETVTWGDKTYPNPLHLYSQILSRPLTGKKSLVHGDLHLRNIMVDVAGHGWLIDFALVKERHNLYDFIKLEVYIRQMVLSQYNFSFADYLQFEESLLDEAVSVPDDPALQKAAQVIGQVRELASQHTRNFAAEYLPALFLYSLAVVKYMDNHGVKAARLAFGTAGVVGGALIRKDENFEPVNFRKTHILTASSSEVETIEQEEIIEPAGTPTSDTNQIYQAEDKRIPSQENIQGNKITGDRNIVGNTIDNTGANIVFGDNIVNTVPPKPSIKEIVERASNMLGMSKYKQAVEFCQEILADAPEHPEANLLAAVALFHGRGADRLRDNTVAQVEDHLHKAISDPTTEATALAVLGIVKYDHYIVNSLFAGKPSLKEITEDLSAVGTENVDPKLLKHIKASSAVLRKLGLIDAG